LQEFFNNENKEFIYWLTRQWRVEFDCVRRDIEIQGSPERTVSLVQNCIASFSPLVRFFET